MRGQVRCSGNRRWNSPWSWPPSCQLPGDSHLYGIWPNREHWSNTPFNALHIICRESMGVPGAMSFRTDRGQATVEAAILIPIIFIGLLMLIQPGIIFYDRVVMEHAAAEGCRMLATSPGAGGSHAEDMIRRHLGAIPPSDLFHIHDGTCSYRIELSGSEGSSVVSVKIVNRVRLLPLFGGVARFSGLSSDGCMDVEVRREARTLPRWLGSEPDPEAWVHARD